MEAAAFTCSRCLLDRSGAPGARFCPRCGLAAAASAGDDAATAPVDITVAGRTYRVLDHVAAGSICNVYRCRFAPAQRGAAPAEGVLKVARDARANAWLANEAAVLRRLHRAGGAGGRLAPFLPRLRESFRLADDGDGGSPRADARRANVLENDPAVRSPDELYTLAEVRAARPAGLDGRDVAWVWRRLLGVLGFAHAAGVAHGAVLPPHVLVEPREHKLVLVDWCSAAAAATDAPAASPASPVPVITGAYLPWYRRTGALRQSPAPSIDVAMGARCMIELLGGDPLSGTCPPRVEPALARHFQRCLGASDGGCERAAFEGRSLAPRLLNEFDRLIEILWGPRTFRALALPPKPHRRHG